MTRHITLVGYFEGLYCAPHVGCCGGLDGISRQDIRYYDVGSIWGVGLVRDRHHAGNVHFIANKLMQVERLVICMSESQRDWSPDPDPRAQDEAKKT